MNKSFGEFLKERRIQNNMTQKEMARQLFVSDSAVSKWEKDIARPDITLLPKLAELLGVTEHELITASIDLKSRQERVQAKKWRTLSFSWNLFFYIAYAVALIPCFICNLAINGTLSWFWIVLSSLVLAFTFTNLPSIIKRHRLILIPASMYGALVLLLGVCCIYTGGNWFLIPTLSVLLGLVMIFAPIYIAKYDIFKPVRKYNDFVSVGISFVMLNLLLFVINVHTVVNGGSGWWYLGIALPITSFICLVISGLLSIRFLGINRFFKVSLILLSIDVILYIPPLFISRENASLGELYDMNILLADLSDWSIYGALENNIHLIIFLSLLLVSSTFALVRIIGRRK